MRKNWLMCTAVLAAGLVTWNEYRLWTRRWEPAPLQVCDAASLSARPGEGLLPTALDSEHTTAATTRPAGEEECDATIIDLTVLQRQTAEPAIADSEEPATFPQSPPRGVVNGPVGATSDLDIPLQFRPHSADPEDHSEPSKFVAAWKRLIDYFRAQTGDEEREPKLGYVEPLWVMPRPYDAGYHHDHPGCPYTGGCPYDGSHYRHATTPAGEEAQEHPTTPKVDKLQKKPKLDTMEVRPGDLPRGWFWKPF